MRPRRIATRPLAAPAAHVRTAGLRRSFFPGLALISWLAAASPPALAFTGAEIELAAQTAAQVEAATRVLAADAFEGRQNDTPGSVAAQEYLIANLSPIAAGLFDGEVGDAAYRQSFQFPTGTNILAVIEGRELAQEYVVVGAHYDHLGGQCAGPGSCGPVANGATDNAAGVAIVLAIGRALRMLPTAPRRSVILAFWDAEEDGLAGSGHFNDIATLPLQQIVSYVNFDIQGANLLPSLRNSSFAIGAETGGNRLKQLTQSAIDQQSLAVRQLSVLFGQDRSDHANFYPRSVPSVFFSDATGGCYHTVGDDSSVVDFGKLAEQSQIGFRLALDLAETTNPPTFQSASSAVYQDAVVISGQLTASLDDLDLFPTEDQSQLISLEEQFRLGVAAGPSQFTVASQFATLTGAATLAEILTHPECDGFLLGSEPIVPALGSGAILVVLGAIATLGAVVLRSRGAPGR